MISESYRAAAVQPSTWQVPDGRPGPEDATPRPCDQQCHPTRRGDESRPVRAGPGCRAVPSIWNLHGGFKQVYTRNIPGIYQILVNIWYIPGMYLHWQYTYRRSMSTQVSIYLQLRCSQTQYCMGTTVCYIQTIVKTIFTGAMHV